MKRKILGIIAGGAVLYILGFLQAIIKSPSIRISPIESVFMPIYIIIAGFVAGYIAKSHEIIASIISLSIVFVPFLGVQISFVKEHGLERSFSGYPTIIGGYLLMLFCASLGGFIAMIIRKRRESKGR